MIRKAMILAAGFGKRIRPLTLETPKPLLKIGKENLLSNTLNFLENYKIDEVIINVHHLGEKISNYINENKFNLNIKVIVEKNEILDTGGGILNVIKNFSPNPFLVINPDTIWNSKYLNEIKLMEKSFFENNKKCSMLVVNKKKSFDQSLKGDFNLNNNLINRDYKNKLDYIYTGVQIIHPDVFKKHNSKIFSINSIWNELITNKELYGTESYLDFLHVSSLEIYNSLIKNFFKD